jgi:RNA polymerase sigma-70 factor (ECF subfamily)
MVPHGEIPDELLVARINNGDEDAFQQLYLRYKDWVLRLAIRLTDDPEIALDVLQETFLYVLSKFPGFELRARFTTFLYPVVRHTSIRMMQKSRRLVTYAHNEDVLEIPVKDRPSQEAVRDDFSAMLRDMPEALRELLILRFVDELELKEIAEAMEIPLGTVKSRLHHALDRLRNYLGQI